MNNNLRQCSAEFEFEFSEVNDKLMQVVIEESGVRYPVAASLVNNKWLATIKVNFDLPTVVSLIFDGKIPGTDTKVDHKGRIVQDLCVKINTVKIDGFPLPEKFFWSGLVLETAQGEQIKGSYVGFNGKITLNFSKSTAFSQFQTFSNC